MPNLHPDSAFPPPLCPTQVLKELGLDDLYGAWHEVLWATRVSDGLERK